MKAQKIKLIAAMITAALVLAGLPLFGQGGTQTSTGVARVSLIKGDVSMERGDSNEWVAVTVNTPLVPGDTIATGAGSRTEVQLDYSNVVRLDQNSEVKIADLNDSRIQLQVARGTVDVAVFQNNQANSEVDTPNVAVEPLQPGTYRIDVNSNSLTLVTVRDGQAQISTPQGSTNVSAGQQITVEGEQNPQYQIVDARPLDNWDYWNRDRNSAIDSAQNYNHVNRYYTGAQDLGNYGRWSYVPGYDWCWTPYVDAGWVPYSNGRWVWEPFYGWTWVSYSPWGWAPYHYGRWFYYGSRWCWWPGAVTPFYRPLWAPAYVSFIGFGYGYHRFSFGFGYGFSSIGWFPLGPRDRYDRWWGHDRDHSFHITNFNNYYGRGGRGRGGFRGSNFRAVFDNAHVRRSIITMPADRFGREAVRGHHGVVSEAMLRRADVVHGTLPVVPTRASLRVTNRAAVVPAGARARANNTRFFTRNRASAPNRNRSFNNQAASIRHMVQTRNVRAPGANRGFSMSRPTGPQGNARGGQQRSSEAQVRGNTRRQNPAPIVRRAPQGRQNINTGNGRRATPSTSGFRRFGTGGPATQSRGNSRNRGSAPVVRQAPQRGNPARRSVQPQPNRSNFRHFGTGGPAVQSRGNSRNRGSAPVVRQAPQRSNPARRSAQPQSNRSNWRSFSDRAPQSSAAFNRGGQRSDTGGRAQQNTGNNFRRFTPQPAPQRGGGSFYNRGSRSQGYYQPRPQRQPSYNRSSRSYSRPPLRLNKPFVNERRYQSNGGSRQRSAPSFNRGYRGGSRPSFNRGSRGGSRPSYSGRSGGGFRGSSPAPSRRSGGGGGRHRR